MEINEQTKLKNKLWKIKNKEKIAIYEKKRRENIEVKRKLRINGLRYYYKNRDKQKQIMKKWREDNKEWFKTYRKNNLIKRGQYQVEYQNKDNNIIIHRLRNRLRFILNQYTKTGKIKSSNKYGIDYKAIIEHLKPFPQNMNEYHIDHIKPLCLFDLTKEEEIKKAFAPENHQWLLSKDNLSKGKYFFE